MNLSMCVERNTKALYFELTWGDLFFSFLLSSSFTCISRTPSSCNCSAIIFLSFLSFSFLFSYSSSSSSSFLFLSLSLCPLFTSLLYRQAMFNVRQPFILPTNLHTFVRRSRSVPSNNTLMDTTRERNITARLTRYKKRRNDTNKQKFHIFF